MEIIFLLIGLAAGITLGYLLASRKYRHYKHR